jgi:hypothetical protein
VADLPSGRRTQRISRGRRFLCQLAIRDCGYSGGTVARFLGATTSVANGVAWIQAER